MNNVVRVDSCSCARSFLCNLSVCLLKLSKPSILQTNSARVLWAFELCIDTRKDVRKLNTHRHSLDTQTSKRTQKQSLLSALVDRYANQYRGTAGKTHAASAGLLLLV